MDIQFTREVMERAFDSLGRKAAARGLVLDLMVYGGSCLVLASNMREASKDIDAVYSNDKPTREVADDLEKEVGVEMALPEHWLSHAVRYYVDPDRGIKPAERNHFADYPRDDSGAVGLRVYLPHPSFMLAMKIMTTRRDQGNAATDKADILGLMKVCSKTSKEDLLALVRDVYPLVNEIPLMARTRIEALVAEYEGSADEPAPTWHP